MGKILPKKKFFKSSIYSPKLNVGSHIDNVRNSLENLIFANEKETERTLLKKRIKVVVFMTVFLMIFSSFFSPKGKAEVVTFYPSSCLGGWVNPSNAENETQVKSNRDSDLFNKDNSAILPSFNYSDIYCGNFIGEIDQNTKPIKMLLSFSWSTGGEYIVNKEIINDSFASSTAEIIDTSSTTEVSFTLSSSTDILSTSTKTTGTSTEIKDEITSTTSQSFENSVQETTTEILETAKEESFIDKAINVISDTLDKIINKQEVDANVSNVITPDINTDKIENIDTVKENVVPIEPPKTEEVPQSTETAPQTYLDKFFNIFVSSFFGKVFAEDVFSDDLTVDVVGTKSTSSEIFNSTNTIESITDVIESVASSSFIENSSTTEIATTSVFENSSTTETILDNSTSTEESKDKENISFLEIFYTFDGVNWSTLGVVNETEMKYRTFEILLASSSSWGDMSQFQIKVQKIANVDKTPTVYLDGIKVEVLYETIVIHEHPDFERDTILQDDVIDGMRIVRIINNDTNEEETWYMYVEEEILSASTTIDIEISSTTETISASTSKIISNEKSTTTLVIVNQGSSSTPKTVVKELLNKSTTTKVVGTSTNSTTTNIVKEVIIPEMKKNVWLKYNGIVTTPTISDINKQEEDTAVKELEKEQIKEEEEASALDLLPDFISDRIKRIRGTFLKSVIVQVKGKTGDELWLYDAENDTQEKIKTGSSTTTMAPDFPFGLKGGFLFWLSEDKNTVYAYNFTNKVFKEETVPPFDATKGGRAEIHFADIPWTVIVSDKKFTFFSKETGEVFSDEDAGVLGKLRDKFNLGTVLNEDQLNNLDFLSEVSTSTE